MLVVQEFLYGFDSHAGMQQQRRCRGAWRMRRINTILVFFTGPQMFLLHRAWEPFQITHEDKVHGAFVHPAGGQGVPVSRKLRAEEEAALNASHLDVLYDGFCRT